MWSNISAPTRSLQQPAAEQAAEVKQLDERNDNNQQQDNVLNGGQVQENLDQASQNQCGSPLMRYKHAVCSAPTGYIYIHGGRFGNSPLDDDIWRFDPHHNSWLRLDTRGCKPPSLQEHTLVEFNEHLYLFGGQVSTSITESSFWCLNLMNGEWRSLSMRSSKFGAYLGPTNRRGHSAVVYGNSMYIYGGFEDFRGSSGQLWEYDLLNERWELRNLSSTSAIHPEPRHSHSAIVHEHSMYIYGGLSNLKPLGDLWRWSWQDKRWFKERTRGRSPGQLHGHTAIQAFGSMFVFGGERNGRTTRSLWRLNLSNMTWQKVRPKGPKPSPTTWHAAIANPLNILDETNYLIEGDSDLLRLTNEGSQMLHNNNNNSLSNEVESQQNTPENIINRLNDRPLSHSKSSSAQVNGWAAPVQHQPVAATRSSKRKSRLSFLRRNNRQERPRSTYELKQIQISASISNFPPTNNRHSIHFAPSVSHQPTQSQKPLQPKTEPETNVKILDNLDTDIKEMFHRAMSPETERQKFMGGDRDEPMSCDTLNQPSCGMTSGKSQYETARQTQRSFLAEHSLLNEETGAMSQRTSYAYTTPPSELNTLKGDSPPPDKINQQENPVSDNQSNPLGEVSGSSRQQALLSFSSGYNRRDNRPKSEIVQSLIERADARIKHLYTPFFNQPPTNGHNHHRRHHINRLSLDKSKRHTIPQTMTYYNLYFSEDKSSNSPPTSGQEDAMEEDDAIVGEGAIDIHSRAENATTGRRMTRDDVSSDTIRGSVATASGSSSGAALVGIHGYLNPAILAQMDQVSQLSLETANSSESRTLCANEPCNGSKFTGRHQATFSTVSSVQSSLQNALTGRKDATGESGDNTSSSFSMIAEFEEDDMLQYSSPTDPIIGPSSFARNQIRSGGDSSRHISPSISPRNSPPPTSSAKRVGTVTGAEQTASSQTTPGEPFINGGSSPDKAHKSASSGYDSISGGFEQSNQQQHPHYSIKSSQPSSSVQSCVPTTSNHQDNSRQFNGEASGASEDTTHEESSVRTESSFNYTTTETSPEQSAQKNQNKKLKGRAYLNRKLVINQSSNKPMSAQTITSSSMTADSLALTSDAFECSSSVEPQSALTKSLPSSPPEYGHSRRSEQAAQRRLPLMSRSKFFGKQKSKTRYWQLCMFVIGGKQDGARGLNEPITIWRLYI